MNQRQRTIIHCDMDAFYASVEQLDFPELREQPVIVGGPLVRGVVSACSYQARAFGVHSAMPMATALRRCPQALLRPVRMARYREVSAEIFNVFRRFTDRIEPLSIDEAFLDVTGCERLFGSGRQIATAIRLAVRNELGLPVSAGVAPNKFLAKLASQQAKPDGLLEIESSAMATFLEPLAVETLWGVGKVTAERLHRRGIGTVAELKRFSRQQLEAWLGQTGEQLYALARGLDERPVVSGEELKSISHEQTFARDEGDEEVLQRVLRDQAERVAARLRAKGLAGRRVTLKVRYGDFTTATRSCTLPEATDHGASIYRTALELMTRTEAPGRPLRLLGVGVAEWTTEGLKQGELFAAAGDTRQQDLDRAVDELNRRFGSGRVRPAMLCGEEEESAEEEGTDRGE